MKKYDVIVVGAGVGLSLAFKAIESGLSVALVEKGHPGGTCINVGCVPSKMLIYPADRIMDIQEAEKLGITADVKRIDFPAIMARMKATINESREWMLNEIRNAKGLDFYNAEARFIGDYSLSAGGEMIKGRKIFIASGARPFIPPIDGLEKIRYLTNENVLNIEAVPGSMIIIGGGYIGVEYAHFFAAMGTRVTLVQRNHGLVPEEEPEVSDLLRQCLSKRMEILTDAEAVEVKENSGVCTVVVKNLVSGERKALSAERIMIASGRLPNTDFLDLAKTGVDTDRRNYIKVDDTLLTTKRHIWALGDVIGRQMFTHAGDMEQRAVWRNATSGRKTRIDFSSVPHAIFTHPQIASVGLTEAQARKDHRILIGRANYSDVVMGAAMMETKSFAKAVVEKDTGRILGFHVIGPDAAILIQEIVNVMALGGDVKLITDNMHIFPALSEVIPESLKNLAEPA